MARCHEAALRSSPSRQSQQLMEHLTLKAKSTRPFSVELASSRLRRSRSLLAMLRLGQGVVGVLWVFLLVLSLIPGLPDLLPGVLLVVVIAPFLVVALVSLQAWRTHKTQRVYRGLKEAMVKDRVETGERSRVSRLLRSYQTYSMPILVKGNATQSLALALLGLGFVMSIVVVVFL